MAENIKKLKMNRKSKLAIFSRKQKHLQHLLDGGAHIGKLKEAYGEVKEAFNILEQAHEEYFLEVEEEVIDAEGYFLEDPAKLLSEMDLRVSNLVQTVDQHKKKSEQEALDQDKIAEEAAATKRELDNAVAVYKSNIELFGKPSEAFEKLSSEKTISLEDMRNELSKIEVTCENLVKY